MARIAFQVAGEIGVRDFDLPLVSLMREAFVVFGRLSRGLVGSFRLRLLLLSRRERTPQGNNQATEHEGRFDFVGHYKIGGTIRSLHRSPVRTLLHHAPLASGPMTDESGRNQDCLSELSGDCLYLPRSQPAYHPLPA